MRAAIITIACALLISGSSLAQIKGAKSVAFFGLDFAEFRLIHAEGFTNRNGTPLCKSLTFKYFQEWNDMFNLEPKKFSVTRYFSIPKYFVELETSSARNQQYNTENCITEDASYSIDPEKFKTIVKAYTSADSNLGLVIIVESMNKLDRICKLYAVFFDTKTHEILSAEKLDGPPGGEGIRNYWINAINNALEKNKFMN